MSFRKMDRSLILSLDELEDDNLETQTLRSTQSSSQTLFKKKGLMGKKLNLRKTTIEFDASDEEVEPIVSPAIKRTKFKSPHSFMTKRQPSNNKVDRKPITEIRQDDINYTLDYPEGLQNNQNEQNEDSMEIEPAVVQSTPAEILREFHRNTSIDDENYEDENIIPINEYVSDDNDNYDLAGAKTNNFPADDDLMPDNEDVFIEDGPLNLASSMKSQKLEIDQDLYDMELHMGEDSEIEFDASKPKISKIIEPIAISEHLKILKESIQKLEASRNETEAQYTKSKNELQRIRQKKEALLQELIQ